MKPYSINKPWSSKLRNSIHSHWLFLWVLLGAVLACGDAGPDASPAPAPAGESEERTGSPEPAPPQPAALPEPAWLGSAVCAECHEEVAARWQGSHHDLAMQEATADSVLGDFDDARLVDGPTTWTFSRREGRFVVHAEGAERGEFEVAYTFGVDPLQQLLIEQPGGRLQALHIAWDARPAASGGQRWFSLYGAESVPPGDPIHWQGPALSWNAMCGDCHSTSFEKGFDLAANRYDSQWAEIDVGCEACHGPGGRHVAWARTGAEPNADLGLEVILAAPTEWSFVPGDPIAKPAGGAPADSGELDTCAPCHSRRTRIAAQPLPGAPFLDGYRPVLLERDLYHDDGQPADEVYVHGSFLQSRMYEAGVRCSDCHDPHSARLRAEGNALCGGCHAPASYDAPAHHHHPEGSEGARCVACHMPAQVFMTIDARREHAFRVPRPGLSLEIGVPNACADCHAERGDAWAAEVTQRWRGDARPPPHFGERLAARWRGGSGAGAGLASLVDDPTEPAIARATALAELGGSPLAVVRLEEAADAEDPLLRLAAARAASGARALSRARRIAPLLEDPLRAVRLEAALALADAESSLSVTQKRSLAAALEEYRAAQAELADQPAAHVNLALLHERLGDEEAAEEAYRTALRIGDYFVPGYVNLADLYGRQGRDGDGATLLHRGLERAPDSPELHFALGLLLVRQQQIEPALEELATAVRLAPEVPHYAYVYGAGLNSAGQVDASLRVLEEAAARHQTDQNLLGAIATIARDAGRFDQALEAAGRLQALFPDRPEAQELIDDIERRRDGAPAPGHQGAAPPGR